MRCFRDLSSWTFSGLSKFVFPADCFEGMHSSAASKSGPLFASEFLSAINISPSTRNPIPPYRKGLIVARVGPR